MNRTRVICSTSQCTNDAVIIVEGIGPLCTRCDIEEQQKHKIICRHCKVPMISKTMLHPVWGMEHASWCPRVKWN